MAGGRRVNRAVALLALGAAAVPAAAVPARPTRQTERNRAVITRFVDLFYRQKAVRRVFDAYVVPDYIQHNPGIADGRDAAIVALEPMFARPGAEFRVKRILVDGDMAAVHLFGGAIQRPQAPPWWTCTG
jgi:predicted SnoaL-like aldol condensation-catalyzing enzyme